MPRNRKEYDKKYYQNNKAKSVAAARKWKATDEGKRKCKIYDWKYWGIITDNWDLTYKYYCEHTNCDICDIILTKGRGSSGKCLDHAHDITNDYNIRGIICSKCNFRDAR